MDKKKLLKIDKFEIKLMLQNVLNAIETNVYKYR